VWLVVSFLSSSEVTTPALIRASRIAEGSADQEASSAKFAVSSESLAALAIREQALF
jgi:hypothetical protein